MTKKKFFLHILLPTKLSKIKNKILFQVDSESKAQATLNHTNQFPPPPFYLQYCIKTAEDFLYISQIFSEQYKNWTKLLLL